MFLIFRRHDPTRKDLRRCAGRRLPKVLTREVMEVDFDGNRAPLHALLEDDRMGVSRAKTLR